MPRLAVNQNNDEWDMEDYCSNCWSSVKQTIKEDEREKMEDYECVEEEGYKCHKCNCKLTNKNY